MGKSSGSWTKAKAPETQSLKVYLKGKKLTTTTLIRDAGDSKMAADGGNPGPDQAHIDKMAMSANQRTLAVWLQPP
ncbi:UNVERIFIED_CONTAM: hypothetical protein K2H54_024583 [Gekko kuhli]